MTISSGGRYSQRLSGWNRACCFKPPQKFAQRPHRPARRVFSHLAKTMIRHREEGVMLPMHP